MSNWKLETGVCLKKSNFDSKLLLPIFEQKLIQAVFSRKEKDTVFDLPKNRTDTDLNLMPKTPILNYLGDQRSKTHTNFRRNCNHSAVTKKANSDFGFALDQRIQNRNQFKISQKTADTKDTKI